MALNKINLEQWIFAPGEEPLCLERGREVKLPHTWNVEDGLEDFWGSGWYRYSFTPEEAWQGKRLRVLFHSVYHDAWIYLNGEEAGVHKNSGYTPFTVELTDHLKFGEENVLTVKADNRFSSDMLPFGRSFDWANDGGLIRPVEMLITGKHFIRNPVVRAIPVITAREERQDDGYGVFGFQAVLDGAGDEQVDFVWELYEGEGSKRKKKKEGTGTGKNGKAEIPGQVLEKINYWHFDSPSLYTLKISLFHKGTLEDVEEIVFGFRDFHVKGNRFYLNGEPVRLPGTEWMPGSDVRHGMAEPKEKMEKMLLRLKESNSILTRFHWQQDDWVYDWCDRHGMLVQEEVPFWGCDPAKAGPQQRRIFQEQMEEMIAAHRNHPSIFAWGVGNELDGQCGETISYIKDALAFTHRLDPSRPANYVSNSIFKGHGQDGTTKGDILMVNDYIGTWHQGYDQYGEWKAIFAENPDKPAVPSEFGLCEPAFSGGDERRNQIFLEKIQCYRTFPGIAGTIYFCLNDYRTQMGEDGEGKYRKRVHGSTDTVGEPKPSYQTVQREYSPLMADLEGNRLILACRKDLPCYTVKGYRLRVGEKDILLPELKPGEVWETILDGTRAWTTAELYRPGGERVLCVRI